MCRLLIVLAVVLLAGITRAQPADPSTLPLVQQADLVNVGGFTVPNTRNNGSFNYGGHVMALAPDGQSLYLSMNGNAVAPITIPAPLVSGTAAALPRASYVQPFMSAMNDQRFSGVGPVKGDRFVGFFPYQNRMIASAIVYYDSNNTQLRSHLALSPDLATASGWSQVWESRKSGFVSGPMAHVPAEWQALLGGPVLATPAAMPIISRTSFGPAAFAFDPAKIGQPVVTAVPLLYYPSNHPTLGPWNGSNPTWGGTAMIGGAVIVPGTRSLLYFGSNGVGPHCYGDGVSSQAQHNPAQEKCYDPLSAAKGSHAYPYKYQVWAYDLNDLAAVKAGTKNPWDVKPYGVWPIDLPINHNREVQFNSVAIHPVTRRIYASQYKGEIYPDGGGQPIVWAFDVKAGSSPPVVTPPPIDPPPVPPMSEVALLKAEIQRLEADVVRLSKELAAAHTAGATTTAHLAAVIAERNALTKRIADIQAALMLILAK